MLHDRLCGRGSNVGFDHESPEYGNEMVAQVDFL
jgi:hypothetical protein